MATPTQVPFTTPGQAPCCCTSECFDASGSAVPTYATNSSPVPLANSWFNISDTDYDALKAGGTYTADLNMFLSTYREASSSCTVGGVPTGWVKRSCTRELSANLTNLPLTITPPVVVNGQPATADEKCMMIMRNTNITLQEYNWRPSFPCGAATSTTSTRGASLGFSRILGKSGTQSKLSCCSHNNTNSAAGSGWKDWMFILSDGNGCGSNSAPNYELHSGNVNGTIPTPGITGQPLMIAQSGITITAQLQINGGTPYTIPNVMLLGYSSNSGVRTQFFSGGSITCGGTSCGGGVNGSSQITLLYKYTGSPP